MRKKKSDIVEESTEVVVEQEEMFPPEEVNYNLFVLKADTTLKGAKCFKGDTVEVDSVSTQKWLKKRNII